MRLVTFQFASSLGPTRRAGAQLADGTIVDLNLAYRAILEAGGHGRAAPVADAVVPPDTLAILQGGQHSLDAARQAIDYATNAPVVDDRGRRLRHTRAEVRLLAPLPRPNSIRDFLTNEEHVRNVRKEPPAEEWFNLPVHYKGNPDAVYGPEDEIPWPNFTARLDYELELAAVIGTPGREIALADSERHIFGYTIFNDWSAREIQRREQSVNLGPAIGKDFANSFGPCIVTTDEFDPATAVMRATIDGEVWSEGTLSAMSFDFGEIVAWLSQGQTLQAGDVLGSGTIGRGCGLELDRWLEPGSVVELEVEGIGVLRNRVGQRPPGALVTGPARRSRPA